MHHPLEKFIFCPVCGNKSFNINDFKSKKCGTCGFTYYANPCSATAAFILNDRGELLVAKRGKEPAKGTLDLPGGFVDMGGTFDLFSPISHPDYKKLTMKQKHNRQILRDAMMKAGFKPLESEWWHFTLKNEPYPDTYFNFDVE